MMNINNFVYLVNIEIVFIYFLKVSEWEEEVRKYNLYFYVYIFICYR